MRKEFLTLPTGQYLSDLNLSLSGSDSVTHIASDTGTGKSTYVMEDLSCSTKVIFTVPQRVQITQLRAKYEGETDIQFFYGGHTSGTPSAPCIVCTYDQLAFIADHVDLSSYTLVVDEVHKVYQAAGYRGRAISFILESIQHQRFQQVVTMSATLSPDLLPFQIDRWIEVQREDVIPRALEVRLYGGSRIINESILSLRPAPGRCLVIRVNDKHMLTHFQKGFEISGLKCLGVSRDVQGTDEVQEMLQAEQICESYDVVLTTSLTDEAINIGNQNIDSVHLYQGKTHSEELRQFIGRFRNQNPPMVLHICGSSLEVDYLSLPKYKQKLDDLAATALQLRENLWALGQYVSADMINTTMHNLGMRISPLKDGETDEDGSPTVQVNQAALLAALYRRDMLNHYASRQRFVNRLKQQFDQITVNFRPMGSNPSDQYESEHHKIQGAVALERTELLQSCWDEVAQDEDGGDVCCIVEDLAEQYDDATPRGKVFADWAALNRTVFHDPSDSFDALLNNRQDHVWNYWKAANEDLLIQPLLIRLSSLPTGTKLSADEACQLFLESYRDVCRQDPAYKDLLRKAGGSNITVKKNNQLSVQKRFVLKVLRHFTHSEIRRSNGVYHIQLFSIHPFGYRYRLHNFECALRSFEKAPVTSAGDPITQPPAETHTSDSLIITDLPGIPL